MKEPASLKAIAIHTSASLLANHTSLGSNVAFVNGTFALVQT
jgi:hypothetical protein